jgi:hypothetical protein
VTIVIFLDFFGKSKWEILAGAKHWFVQKPPKHWTSAPKGLAAWTILFQGGILQLLALLLLVFGCLSD